MPSIENGSDHQNEYSEREILEQETKRKMTELIAFLVPEEGEVPDKIVLATIDSYKKADILDSTDDADTEESARIIYTISEYEKHITHRADESADRLKKSPVKKQEKQVFSQIGKELAKGLCALEAGKSQIVSNYISDAVEQAINSLGRLKDNTKLENIINDLLILNSNMRSIEDN